MSFYRGVRRRFVVTVRPFWIHRAPAIAHGPLATRYMGDGRQ